MSSDKPKTNLERAMQHPNWAKAKAYSLEQAASRAMVSQTMSDFRFLKAFAQSSDAVDDLLVLEPEPEPEPEPLILRHEPVDSEGRELNLEPKPEPESESGPLLVRCPKCGRDQVAHFDSDCDIPLCGAGNPSCTLFEGHESPHWDTLRGFERPELGSRGRESLGFCPCLWCLLPLSHQGPHYPVRPVPSLRSEPEPMGDCPECGNTGFSKPGTGYGDVCDFCGGSSASADGMPIRVGGVAREPEPKTEPEPERCPITSTTGNIPCIRISGHSGNCLR